MNTSTAALASVARNARNVVRSNELRSLRWGATHFATATAELAGGIEPFVSDARRAAEACQAAPSIAVAKRAFDAAWSAWNDAHAAAEELAAITPATLTDEEWDRWAAEMDAMER